MRTKTRDWRIYADFAQRLIGIARKLYINDPFGVDLANTAYALDSTTIDLSLSLFPWAPFRTTKAAVKMHTLLDLRGNIPSFIHISDGKLHDVNILDQLIPEAAPSTSWIAATSISNGCTGCYQAGSFFVTRASQLDAQRRYSHPIDRSTGRYFRSNARAAGISVRAKVTRTPFAADPFQGSGDWQTPAVHHQQHGLARLDHFRSVSRPVGRWSCFSGGSKRILRIKAFFGTSENAVKPKSGSPSRSTCSLPSSESA